MKSRLSELALALVGAIVLAGCDEAKAPSAVTWTAPADELSASVLPGEIDVRNFGAKGDGIADDTEAIELACAAAQKHDDAVRCRDGKFGEGDGPHQPVVFPAGTYRVTRTLFLGRDAYLRGLAGAELKMDDAGADIVYVHHAARVHVEGLRFRGGRHQLNVATLNNENANVIVRGCEFVGAASNGFHSVSRVTTEVAAGSKFEGTRKQNEQPLGEFMPDDQGVFRRDARFDRAEGFNNSTFFMIEDSFFNRCAHAIEMHSDGGVVRNCRVIHPAGAGAPFILPEIRRSASAEFHYYGLEVLVERNGRDDQSFFDMRRGTHTLAIDDSSFRTSDGSGIVLFDSRSASPYFYSSLIVRNTSVTCGGNPRNCILFLHRDSAPQILHLENVTDTTGLKVYAVNSEGVVDDKWLRKAMDRFDDDRRKLEDYYTFAFSGLSANISTDLGRGLNRFVKAFPSDLPKPVVARQTARVRAGRRFFAADFGVKADGKSDDSAALQRMADAMAVEPGAVGVLPNEWIAVSKAIRVAGDCTFLAGGSAAFRHLTDKTAFFEVANGSAVKFRNLVFKDAKHVVKFAAEKARTTEIVLDNCFAYNTARLDKFDGAMFDIRAKDNASAVKFVVTAGSYYAAICYRGNVTTMLDGFWFRSLPNGDGKDYPRGVAFVNEAGGVMRAVDVLGVPCTLAQRGRMSYNPNQFAGDYRWFDNYGKLWCENVRFGGEYGGIIPVYAYGSAETMIVGQMGEFKTLGNRLSTPIVSDSDAARSTIVSMLYISRALTPEQMKRIRVVNSLYLPQ